MSFLAQFLMLGMDSVGALATFEGGNDFFTAAINSTADTIAAQFTRQALRPLMVLNGQDPTGIMLTHTPAGDMELDLLGNFLRAVEPFITITPDDEVAIRAMARLPEKSVDEVIAAREEKRQMAQEQAAQFRPAQPQGNQPPQLQTNSADWYAITGDNVAGNAPDDDDRLRMERTWYDTAVDFFEKQRRRVIKGVKEM